MRMPHSPTKLWPKIWPAGLMLASLLQYHTDQSAGNQQPKQMYFSPLDIWQYIIGMYFRVQP